MDEAAVVGAGVVTSVVAMVEPLSVVDVDVESVSEAVVVGEAVVEAVVASPLDPVVVDEAAEVGFVVGLFTATSSA